MPRPVHYLLAVVTVGLLVGLGMLVSYFPLIGYCFFGSFLGLLLIHTVALFWSEFR